MDRKNESRRLILLIELRERKAREPVVSMNKSVPPRLNRMNYKAGPKAPVRIVHLGLGAFHRAHQARTPITSTRPGNGVLHPSQAVLRTRPTFCRARTVSTR